MEYLKLVYFFIFFSFLFFFCYLCLCIGDYSTARAINRSGDTTLGGTVFALFISFYFFIFLYIVDI
jgi:hypothetical protein